MSFVNRRIVVVLSLVAPVPLSLSLAVAFGPPEPPVARVVPVTHEKFGDTRIDHYGWLRDRQNPETIAYLEAENAYTAAMLKDTEPLQQKLYAELLGRIKETDLSVPARDGEYYYYTRTAEGKQYPIYCRRKGSETGPEEVLLDQNALAADHPYFQIGVFEVSPDHRLLAHAVDTRGNETFTLRVKDLTTGQLLPDRIEGVAYGLAWANDNRTFFYTTEDATKRPYRILRHELGADPGSDAVVYQEDDVTFNVDLEKSLSRKYIFIRSNSTRTDEWRFIDADRPADPPALIQPRETGVEYSVTHHDERFFIVTNDQATNFRLMETAVAAPGKPNWHEIIPNREDIQIVSAEAFVNHLVITERSGGLPMIRISALDSGQTHYLDFPEPAYTASVGDNREFNTTTLRFNYASLVTPRSVFDYDLERRTRVLRKQDEVLGGFDPANYESQRIHASAPDGTLVPISLVYRRGLTPDGSAPGWLTGYGSYGASSDPRFSSNIFSLLDRGFVFAIAHIRGGSELGRPWYLSGRMLHKKNTFTDFIACAEQLIARQLVAPGKLVISGGSAGGLLMGAVLNMRPELFRAAIANVPFVDVMNTMLDPSIPLTTAEYDEWGNPNEEQYYRYMRSYSPYDNVEAKAYPHLLVTAGLNDPRVGYWEPAKWVAKLRALKTDTNLLLLKTEMGAGHAGPSGRYERLREKAFEYAFVFKALGISE